MISASELNNNVTCFDPKYVTKHVTDSVVTCLLDFVTCFKSTNVTLLLSSTSEKQPNVTYVTNVTYPQNVLVRDEQIEHSPIVYVHPLATL